MRVVQRELSDQERYATTKKVAWGGWMGTVAIVGLRAVDALPQSVGSFALLTLGVGVTASLALSRWRLGNTVVRGFTEVFQAGMKAAITLSANVFTDTCIMALDRKGIISSVDHADAIGWEPEELVGRELRALLSPRSKGSRKIEAGTTISSPMINQSGQTFDARISVAALGKQIEGGDPLAVDDGVLVVTISPVVSSGGGYRLESDE